MNSPTFVVLICCFASIALGEDFKTIDGKEYKNATVNRIEPDGILLRTRSGIAKVYFGELPKEVQERFHYDAPKAAQFTAASQKAVEQLNEFLVARQQREAQERQRQAEAIARQQQQAEEQQRQTEAIALRQQQQPVQAQQRYAHQQPQKATARRASERGRQRQIAAAATSQRAQEDQRIQRENQRNIEKMQREHDMRVQEQSVEFARLRDSVMRRAESRENYKREQEQLKQLQDRQRWETGNRATAY